MHFLQQRLLQVSPEATGFFFLQDENECEITSGHLRLWGAHGLCQELALMSTKWPGSLFACEWWPIHWARSEPSANGKTTDLFSNAVLYCCHLEWLLLKYYFCCRYSLPLYMPLYRHKESEHVPTISFHPCTNFCLCTLITSKNILNHTDLDVK